jgi:hypothetical protein
MVPPQEGVQGSSFNTTPWSLLFAFATVIDHLGTDIRQTAPDIRQPAMRIHRQTIDAHRPLILPHRPAIHPNGRSACMKRFAIHMKRDLAGLQRF